MRRKAGGGGTEEGRRAFVGWQAAMRRFVAPAPPHDQEREEAPSTVHGESRRISLDPV